MLRLCFIYIQERCGLFAQIKIENTRYTRVHYTKLTVISFKYTSVELFIADPCSIHYNIVGL